MSGPFGVNMTVISGQKFSGEIVVAASTLLSMSYLYINPVAKNVTIRPEFRNVLNIFCYRERVDRRSSPGEFEHRILQPANTISTGGHFWLAFDQEGEILAREIFAAQGKSPNERFYSSVRKLSLLKPFTPPPPQIRQTLWQKLFPSSPDPRTFRNSYLNLSYMDRTTPLTLEQTQYYAWLETLYEALIPWQDTIKNIQSDYS